MAGGGVAGGGWPEGGGRRVAGEAGDLPVINSA